MLHNPEVLIGAFCVKERPIDSKGGHESLPEADRSQVPGNPRDGGPIVMKFGGSSVADAERLRCVARIARAEEAKGVLIVVSALAKVTDGLIACGKAAILEGEGAALESLDTILSRHYAVAEELFGDRIPVALLAVFESARIELTPILRGASLLGSLPEQSRDYLAGRGELLSSAILASFMEVPSLDARAVLRTDSRFGEARPLESEIAALATIHFAPLIGPGMIAVTQGYIGSDALGKPTTLGRGGSDYSASLLGAALGASEIQIWTDVEGVLTCDPRVVPEARPVEVLGYDEAAELAAFGAKVLHPATIRPAVLRGIPVTVRNSLVSGGRFTTISRGSASGLPVTALASRAPLSVVTVSTPRMLGGAGFLARIFEVFGRRGVSVDSVATSEVSVSVTVDESTPIAELLAELETFAAVRVQRGRAVVALVGERLRRTPGICGRAFQALNDINVEMISMGASEINLSLVVAADRAEEAQRRLHAAFFGDGRRS